MKPFPFVVAMGALVALSAIDFALMSAEIYIRAWPSVGWWGVICAVFLGLSLVAIRVGEKHGRTLKGAYIGFVSPILAAFLGHRGFATVVLLFVPIVVAAVLAMRTRPTVSPMA